MLDEERLFFDEKDSVLIDIPTKQRCFDFITDIRAKNESFSLAIDIGVCTGAALNEVVNVQISPVNTERGIYGDFIEQHKNGITYAIWKIQRGAKGIRTKAEKIGEKDIVTQYGREITVPIYRYYMKPRTRYQVVNSRLWRKIKNYYFEYCKNKKKTIGGYEDKLSLIQSIDQKVKDGISRQTLALWYQIYNPPFNAHELTSNKEITRMRNGKEQKYHFRGLYGARHLYKRYIKAACRENRIPYDFEQIRKSLGHVPRDSEEKYDRYIDFDAMLDMVEPAFANI